MPYALSAAAAEAMIEQVQARRCGVLRTASSAGFLLTFGEDDSGIGPMYARRGSGYYIDVGASDLIADGEIKLKTGVEIKRLTATSAS